MSQPTIQALLAEGPTLERYDDESTPTLQYSIEVGGELVSVYYDDPAGVWRLEASMRVMESSDGTKDETIEYARALALGAELCIRLNGGATYTVNPPLFYDKYGLRTEPRHSDSAPVAIAFEDGAEPRPYERLTEFEQYTVMRWLSYLAYDEDRLAEARAATRTVDPPLPANAVMGATNLIHQMQQAGAKTVGELYEIQQRELRRNPDVDAELMERDV